MNFQFDMLTPESNTSHPRADMDCSVHPAVQNYTIVCWLYRFVNQGHDFESRLGIPSWMTYFSTPDRIGYQLAAAVYILLVFFTMGLFVPVCNLLRPSTRRDWLRRNVKQFAKFVALYWLTMVIVSI